VAYAVPQPSKKPSLSDLRRFLQGQLPNYMHPSTFILLEELPRLPNGKVNRHELPAPDSLRPDMEVDYVIPQNKTEKDIVAVWQKVLNLEKVGIYDNFFELGGHSLLMIQIHGELQEIFGQELSIVELFKFPTIHSLAQHLSHKPSEQSSSELNQNLVNLRNVREAAIRQQRQLRQKYRPTNK
jgi:acyl carrier protein